MSHGRDWRSVALALLVLLALALAVGLRPDFAVIKAHHGQWQALVQMHPLLAPALFFFGFVLVTALSVPVATLLALLAGSLFPFWQALLLVSVAASVGATQAMLMSRHFLRHWVESRWPLWLESVNRGLEKDGLFYLLALRLAPTPPFFVVNLLMGLTRMPVLSFFLVSQVGMLPLDAVFVNAGRTLAAIESPEQVLSPATIAALALAGLLPLLLRRLRRRDSSA